MLRTKNKLPYLIPLTIIFLTITIYASPPDVPILISPVNKSITSGDSMLLDFYIYDSDGDALSLYIYGGNSSNSLSLLDRKLTVPSGKHISVTF
jgi:hypothetical protein